VANETSRSGDLLKSSEPCHRVDEREGSNPAVACNISASSASFDNDSNSAALNQPMKRSTQLERIG